MQTSNPAYQQARRHVERKLGFFIHAGIYVLVNSGLFMISWLASGKLLWPFAPLLGWGIGLAMHGLAVYLKAPGRTWKERLIEKELARTRT